MNKPLIEKLKKLLCIKSYYTEQVEHLMNKDSIIERYHQRYKIAEAIRISKSDLQTTPILYFKEESIKLYMLISLIALVISKHTELRTGLSLNKFVTECKKITAARMLKKITNIEVNIKAILNPEITDLIKKLNVPH